MAQEDKALLARLHQQGVEFVLTDKLCSSLENLHLQTDLGKLDCLSEVTGVGDYEAALSRSIEFNMSFGQIHMFDLETLILSKEAAGREKDKYALPLLRALAEKTKQTRKS